MHTRSFHLDDETGGRISIFVNRTRVVATLVTPSTPSRDGEAISVERTDVTSARSLGSLAGEMRMELTEKAQKRGFIVPGKIAREFGNTIGQLLNLEHGGVSFDGFRPVGRIFLAETDPRQPQEFILWLNEETGQILGDPLTCRFDSKVMILWAKNELVELPENWHDAANTYKDFSKGEVDRLIAELRAATSRNLDHIATLSEVDHYFETRGASEAVPETVVEEPVDLELVDWEVDLGERSNGDKIAIFTFEGGPEVIVQLTDREFTCHETVESVVEMALRLGWPHLEGGPMKRLRVKQAMAVAFYDAWMEQNEGVLLELDTSLGTNLLPDEVQALTSELVDLPSEPETWRVSISSEEPSRIYVVPSAGDDPLGGIISTYARGVRKVIASDLHALKCELRLGNGDRYALETLINALSVRV